MARIFRKKNARGEVLPKWYLDYHDAQGRRRSEAAFRDKRASEQLLAQREREAAQGRMGLVDPHADAAKTPLTQHAADFGEHLQARGVTAKHRKLTLARLRKALEAMPAAWPKDLSARKAERFLTRLREDGARAKTINDYLSVLTQFGAWGVRERRWPENPFKPMKRLNVEADKTERRALSLDELRALCEAAKTRAYREAVALYPDADAAQALKAKRLAEGQERSVVYLAAGLSGLRLNELATLTWGDVDLDAGRVTVRAENAKSGRQDTIPMPDELAHALRAWREEAADLGRDVGEGGRVFRITSKLGRHHFHKDAEAAGLERIDAAGRVLVFHSLRHTFITFLSQAGVSPRVAQAMARHADLQTTMKRYTHVELLDMRQAAEALPQVLAEPDAAQEELRAAVGAESVALPVPLFCAPRGAKAGKGCQEGGEKANSQNPRLEAENGSYGGNCPQVTRDGKKWRRRESKAQPPLIQRRGTPIHLGQNRSKALIQQRIVPKRCQSLITLRRQACGRIRTLLRVRFVALVWRARRVTRSCCMLSTRGPACRRARGSR